MPAATPSAGAAMWMPMRTLPFGSGVTENASSISVVEASSMLKAAASDERQVGGRGSAGSAADSGPRGKCSKRKRLRW